MTQLVGIINLTPDSFSDGRSEDTPEAAVERIHCLIAEGATVIDIGAESTRPNAVLLSPEEEWARLEPVLLTLYGNKDSKPSKCEARSGGGSKAMGVKTPCNIEISIDTRHAVTAAKALALGVNWINDVSAGAEPEIWRLVAQYPQATYVLMHALTIPANPQITLPQACDPIEVIAAFFVEKLQEMERVGLKREQVILDVGIGFGKTAEQSLSVMRNIKALQFLGLPLLVGHSRKSCFRAFTGDAVTAAERDGATVAASLYLARQGVDYLRVHAVGLHQQALAVGRFYGGV
jgi:dihydropteroate synthase